MSEENATSDEKKEPSEHEQAVEEMREFEKQGEVPHDLNEWPQGKAKYVTYGEDSDEAYGAGPTENLGPAEVEHHEDGSVSVAGEKVDDPSKYKGEPIKSGVVEQIEESKKRYRELQEENPELKEKGGGESDAG